MTASGETPPLPEDAYEPIREALFENSGGQSASTAKRLADNIAANPLALMLWLTDARIVEHVQFVTPEDRRVRISVKDAPPFMSSPNGGGDQ